MKKAKLALSAILVIALAASALAKPGDYHCFRTPYGFICTAG
jgi:hypothetical protein